MGTIGDLLAGVDLSALTGTNDANAADMGAQPKHDDRPSPSDKPQAGGTQEATVASDTQDDVDTPPVSAGERAAHSATGAHTQDLTPEEIALSALIDHSTLDPHAARRDLTLRGDLDMDDLQLYAVVTQMERALKRSFPDEDVHSWVIVGDILDAVTSN